jgi:hypothetical protein
MCVILANKNNKKTFFSRLFGSHPTINFVLNNCKRCKEREKQEEKRKYE